MARFCLAAILMSVSSLSSTQSVHAQNSDWEAAERTTGAASVQASELRPVQLSPYRGIVAIDNVFYTQSPGSTRAVIYSPMLRFEHRPRPMFYLGARIGLSHLNVSTPSSTSGVTNPSNLELSGGYILELGTYPSLYELRIGGRFTVPTLHPDGTDERLNVGAASAVRLSRDLWMWAPRTASLTLPVSFRTKSRIHFAAELEIAALISLEDPDDDSEAVVQLLLEGGYRVLPQLLAGAGLSMVALPTFDGDQFQSAIGAFLRANFSGIHVGGEFWMNLDDPLGFAFDDDGFWGLTITLGVGLP